MDQEIRYLQRLASVGDQDAKRLLNLWNQRIGKKETVLEDCPEEQELEKTWWHQIKRYYFLPYSDDDPRKGILKAKNWKTAFHQRDRSKRKTLRSHRDGRKR